MFYESGHIRQKFYQKYPQIIPMVKLKVKVGAKGQVVIPKVIRDKLGIKPDDVLLVDEEGGKIVIEKQDIDDFIEWVKKTRKKVAGEVYRIALEDEFE